VPERVQLETLIASIGLLAAVFELIRRRKLSEEYSFLWILLAGTLFVVSIRGDVLAVAVGAVLIVCLCLSVIVSRQRRQIERLIEETAILSAELRELRATSPVK
jgi:Ca2+/Na+ antiporter